MLLPSLFTATTLFTVYRFTINFPNLPYSNELKRPGSAQFVKLSQEISDALNTLLSSIPSHHNVTVRDYRYQQVLGTLVTVEITSRRTEPTIWRLIKRAVRSGHIGRFAVGTDGFEYYTINGH
ncbi:unnamed protein product [Gongylonema pulchrum]|uniref:SEA domain-containing protein n=1 Tax=Gongylonema pulchrum TaxID=637853 RepID=A0A183CUM8_9BILA|nr:unnamed protein product [Gongylonema pulchrum]